MGRHVTRIKDEKMVKRIYFNKEIEETDAPKFDLCYIKNHYTQVFISREKKMIQIVIVFIIVR